MGYNVYIVYAYQHEVVNEVVDSVRTTLLLLLAVVIITFLIVRIDGNVVGQNDGGRVVGQEQVVTRPDDLFAARRVQVEQIIGRPQSSQHRVQC
jgi:hypothetical protein